MKGVKIVGFKNEQKKYEVTVTRPAWIIETYEVVGRLPEKVNSLLESGKSVEEIRNKLNNWQDDAVQERAEFWTDFFNEEAPIESLRLSHSEISCIMDDDNAIGAEMYEFAHAETILEDIEEVG